MPSFSQAGQHELHVLAVDDSPVDLAVIRCILQHCNCRVTAVDSVERALKLLDLGIDVNLVITDYWMPAMTGYDLLKRMKELPKLRAILVAIICCQDDQNQISRCFAEGAEAYLLKPAQLSNVSGLIRDLV